MAIGGKMMKEMAESFTPGKAALFVLIKKATDDKVLEGMKKFCCKGKVFKTSLSKDDEDTLREVLEKA